MNGDERLLRPWAARSDRREVPAAVAVAQSEPVAPERVGELPGALRPPGGVLRQAAEDDGFEPLVDRGATGARRLRELVRRCGRATDCGSPVNGGSPATHS